MNLPPIAIERTRRAPPGDAQATLHVLVATPLGKGGQGGIDRMMDAIRLALPAAEAGSLSVRFVATRGAGPLLLSPFHLAVAGLRLLALRWRHGARLLHVNLSADGSFWRKSALCALAGWLGVPYVLHLHGARFRQFHAEARPLTRSLIAGTFRRAACILVLGRVWRDFVLGEFPDLADRVVILPNASSPAAPVADAAPATDPTPTILFLGELGPRKGVPQLTAALALLPERPIWRAVLAGNGAVEATRRLLRQHGLQDAVTLTGWVDPPAVEALLRRAAILVLPSFDENLPMSVIEAMAHGLAVVATPVGATADIIEDGRTGLLVSPGDVEGLAAALARLLADPVLRARLGAAARAFHAEHLAITPYVARLIAIWRATADPRPPG